MEILRMYFAILSNALIFVLFLPICVVSLFVGRENEKSAFRNDYDASRKTMYIGLPLEIVYLATVAWLILR